MRIALLLLSALAAWGAVPAAELRVVKGAVVIVSAGEQIAASPEEGLWSIACDWRDGWPADWRHASPSEVSQAGEWTVLKGELKACGGIWLLEDAYRPAKGVIEGRRRSTWKGPGTPKATLSVRFQTRAQRSSVLLPGILYYGNPSGAKSGRVPVFSGKSGEEALFEEHRYPMPFAYVEMHDAAALRGAALHSLPSPAAAGNLKDQWWSLGVVQRKAGTEMTLLSGPCASNGQRSVVKAVQRGFVPYDNAYLNVAPGTVIEKTFWLEAFPVAAEGTGFSRPVETSLRLFEPADLDNLPGFAEIVRAKYRFAKSRWIEADGAAGFRKFQDRNFFVMGWCGQAEALGYALQVLASGLDDPAALDRVRRTLDFLSSAQFFEGGFHTWYDYEKREWSRNELVSQGQAMLSFARAIEAAKKTKLASTKWEAFLRRACDFHSKRILGESWRPLSTSEALFIAPLLKAHRLFGADEYRRAAVKAAAHYAERHLSMREPYWGGTLDAQCEDKEGAAAAFEGFLALYDVTKDPEHLRWARHACDAVLTYVVVWDIDMPAGRLRDHAFQTGGWTVVSPQNQHLDVWGVLLAPEIYRLAQIEGREDLKRLALKMYRSCGQLIDVYGSQGEQIQHTNYVQGSRADDLFALRGGYHETWTVFWITAHFLTGAARFAELGVPIWDAPLASQAQNVR